MTSCSTTHNSGHLTHHITESVKASIHAFKLHHDHIKRHTTRGRRRSRGGWREGGLRNRCLSPWLLWSKPSLAPSNGRCAQGTHKGEVSRLGIRNRKVVNDPYDSKRKDELITGLHILIDINKRENEMIGKVYSKVLSEGQQKASTRLSNRIIVRQGI